MKKMMNLFAALTAIGVGLNTVPDPSWRTFTHTCPPEDTTQRRVYHRPPKATRAQLAAAKARGRAKGGKR